MRKVLYLALIALLVTARTTYSQVNADFSINYSFPDCAPSLITFTNTSTGLAPLSYQWNFGIVAGVNSTQLNPSTTYLTCGTYNVTLTTTNGVGQTSTIVHPVTIHCKPQSSFTSPGALSCTPVSATFLSTSTSSAAFTNYVWDFGDGVGGSGSNPSHIYSSSGCKNVTLVVTDANGCWDDTTVVNAACPAAPPIADFTSTPAQACAAPLTVTYQSANPGAGGPFTYQWTFQGGTPGTAAISNPTVDYNTPGNYWTKLIVTAANGCTDTIIKYNYVIIGLNVADFTLDNLSGCSPLTIYCAGPQYSPAINVQWTAVGGTQMFPNQLENYITFNNPGTYQICLELTFVGNCIATKCTTVTVDISPQALFSVTGLQNVCAPPINNVHYTNLSTGGAGLTYQWQFPGGTPSSSTSANPPNIDYTQCGVFSPVLIVTSPAGCTDTLVMDSLVQVNCPVANFVASAIHGCIPFDVTFNSSGSYGMPVQWEWNFGDAGNGALVQSTLQNPSHTYTTTGCFHVRLIITNALGCKDTLKLFNYICTGTPPVASFVANPVNACIGDVITFTNTSTGISNASSYQWDFNGGPPFATMSASKNPTYTYSDTGFFDVALIVCNNGCCDTTQLYNYIHISPPLAKITVDKSCINRFDVTLHGENSIGANSYLWSIPGGVPSTSTIPTLAVHFPTTGTFTATLTVTNSTSGCTNTLTVTIQIRDVQADFNITPTTGCAPYNFCMSNASVDASTYWWTIWNSSTGVVYYNGNPVNPCPTLQFPGVYTVRLIATDVNGCKDTLIKPSYLTVYGTLVNFSATPTTGCTPLTVNFTDLSVSTTSTITGWSWDFGDPGSGAANFSTLQNPSHTYYNGGTYSVTLAVTDNHGCVNVKTTNSNYITAAAPIIAFFANDTSVCLGQSICFINNTTDPVGWITYNWDFGDGAGNTTLPVPCYTYTDTGWFDVTLYAQDWWGCKDTLTIPTYIHITTPYTNFIADNTTSICPPLQVNFTNLSTGYDSLTTFVWDFGDGTTSTAFNPFHIYTTAGQFDVTLTMTTADGCVATVSFPDYISITGPTANVNVTPVTGCSPLTACFNAFSNNTNFYIWNFGEGTVDLSNTDTICFTYTVPGIYFPQVILDDGMGCAYTYPLDSIIVSHVVAGFTLSGNDFCNNGTVAFTDTSSSTVALATWNWNFGDAASGVNNTSSNQNPSHAFNSPGVYVVTETVTDALLCTTTFIDTVIIHQLPDAQFTISANPVCPGTAINFVSTSTSADAITIYQWNFGDAASGVLNTATTANASHIYNSSGIYSVKLSVFTAYGCTDSLIQNVTINVPPTSNAGPDQAICINSSANLIGTGGVGYAWSPSTGLSATNISNPIANPLSTITYTLIVSDAIGCTGSDQMILTVNPLPAVNAGANVAICLNTTATLTATGAINYFWTPSTALSSTNTAATISSATSTLQYVVTGTDGNGCVNSDSVIITVNPLPIANAGIDIAICKNDSTQLLGAGGINYLWSNAASLNDATLSSPVASPMNTTTYTLVVTDANGCTDNDNVIVTVNPLPLVSAGADQDICINSAAQLNATGAISYLWNPTATLTSTTISNPSATPLTTETYTVFGTDANGCSSGDAVVITVHNYPAISAGADQTVCINTPATLTATGGISYTWSPNTALSSSIGATVIATPTVTTTYIVDGIDVWGCVNTDTMILNIVSAPVADAGLDTSICEFKVAHLTATGGISYLWSPAASLSSNTISNPDANPSSTTTYTVVVTDANGCTASDNVVLTILLLPAANAGIDQDICINFNAQLIATGGVGYLWTPNNTLSDSVINNPIASPMTSTTYSVLVTGANGCTATDNMAVIVHNNPIISAGSDVTICYGTSTLLNATGGATYNWSPITALNNGGIASPTASPTTTTQYVVQGISTWGCINYDTVIVNVLAPPPANAGTDTAICYGQKTPLHATGGISYSWSPSALLDNALIADPIASPTSTTDFIVTVTDTNSCSANDTVKVVVNPLPLINAGPDVNLCLGSPVQLNATGGVSYQWTPATSLDNSAIANPITSTSLTTNYIVTGLDNIGCANSDSVLVTVIYPLTAHAVPWVDVCQGMQTQLSASGGMFYEWQPATGLDNASIPNPTCVTPVSKDYMVIVSDGICFSDTAYVHVEVHALPQVYAGDDQIILAGQDAPLSGSGTGVTYEWVPATDVDCPICEKTNAHPDNTTTYTLWATNDYGCSSYDEVEIRVGCTDDVVYIPNAFSPNGDGNNEKLYVRSKGLKTLNYMRIYDRWGTLIYDSQDLSEGWDGTIRGKMGMPGVYVWYMEGICSNGQTVELQGNVTLVR